MFKKVPNDRTHNFTLLDGEMVIDTLPTKKLARRYLIYDLMVLNGKPVIEVRLENISPVFLFYVLNFIIIFCGEVYF